MSKRNVLLFLSGGSWRALAGGAGQGKAVSLARALRGLPHLLPSLDSHQLPLACPSPSLWGAWAAWGWSPDGTGMP